MFELIVRLCRAIACRQRLRILSFLAPCGEASPTLLGAKLGLPKNVLSHHLRLLASVGLISSRKSGVNCYYAFRSPYGEQTLSGAMSRWLQNLLRHAASGGNNCEVRELRNLSADQKKIHEAIFQAATAFTDLRRLQILRHIHTRAEASVEQLMTALKMSRFAVCRQTAKLQRRGYLAAQRNGRLLIFRMNPTAQSPVHASMWRIVQTALLGK